MMIVSQNDAKLRLMGDCAEKHKYGCQVQYAIICGPSIFSKINILIRLLDSQMAYISRTCTGMVSPDTRRATLYTYTKAHTYVLLETRRSAKRKNNGEALRYFDFSARLREKT